MTAGTHILGGVLLAVTLKLPVIPAAFGSVFPDLDLNKGLPHPSKRNLFNSHRGITHHPAIPILLFLLSYLLKLQGIETAYTYLLSFTLGYASHLLLDILNPLGIPYKFSYYPRFSLKLMKSGKVGEIFVILLLLVSLVNVIEKKGIHILDKNTAKFIKNLYQEVTK